ncbi:MAG: DEAD/DEAH box helicase [Chthoniobacterales bacterium]
MPPSSPDPTIELTEKSLMGMGGWQIWKQARAIHESGRVSDATYDPPLLKGRITEGGKEFSAGLKFNNRIDVDNLCPCRDSRVRALICAHSIAVGLQVLKPRAAREKSAAAKSGVSSGGGAPSATTTERPTVELKIEGSLRHLEAEISFRYQRPGASNPAAEGAALARLVESGFREEKGKAVIKGEADTIRFFAAELPKLKQAWLVTEGERFQNVTKDFVRIEPRFALREAGDGFLDLHVHHSAGSEAVLSHADLSRLLQSGRGHLKLKNGSVAVADGAIAADLDEMLRDCDPQQERGGYRIPAVHRGYVERSIADWSGGEAAAKAGEVELGGLESRLRPYQVDGARWLLGQAEAGSGGLLADEMGLGKTVQTLAMIERLEGPTLVVCPSSLVWNWKREARTFLPDLSVLTLDGPDRKARFEGIEKHRLVVTSYALLRRDLEAYRGIEFTAVVLDEAQHIKNPDSQNAKAAGALVARSRFILTGTPIENSVRDLWSLYEFLLPGYLGDRKDFQDRYETPLLNGERGAIWSRLLRRIQPYLLRRRKAEILDDLPDKIEQVLEIELTEKQKAAYTQLQRAARSQIDAMAKDQGGAARMKALTALLRLRQACCDLRLLGGELPVEVASAKLVALVELLEESIDGGHRTLVFSQFTGMLDRIGESLNEAGIAFCRLDGSTKNREAVVDRFQESDDIPVFLISLKAGGVGLNLTAADTVIHFDPWWNPAVEAQATDRAHRIGQKKVVTSIKLIARDTVEERVLAMQRKKRELLEGTVDADDVLQKFAPEDFSQLVGD